MTKLFLIGLSMIISMVLIDLVWIGVIAKNFYFSRLGHLFAEKPNLLAAIIFYVLYIVGLMVFIVSPNLANGFTLKTLLLSAFFGLVAYGTYDLTNQALVKGWPLIITIADMIWGSLLTSAIVAIGLFVGRLLA